MVNYTAMSTKALSLIIDEGIDENRYDEETLDLMADELDKRLQEAHERRGGMGGYQGVDGENFPEECIPMCELVHPHGPGCYR